MMVTADVSKLNESGTFSTEPLILLKFVLGKFEEGTIIFYATTYIYITYIIKASRFLSKNIQNVVATYSNVVTTHSNVTTTKPYIVTTKPYVAITNAFIATTYAFVATTYAYFMTTKPFVTIIKAFFKTTYAFVATTFQNFASKFSDIIQYKSIFINQLILIFPSGISSFIEIKTLIPALDLGFYKPATIIGLKP